MKRDRDVDRVWLSPPSLRANVVLDAADGLDLALDLGAVGLVPR